MQNASTTTAPPVPFVWTNMPLSHATFFPKSFSELMDEDLAHKLQEQEKKQTKKKDLSLLSDEELALELAQMNDSEMEAYFRQKEQKERDTQPMVEQKQTQEDSADNDYLLALKLQQEEEDALSYERPNNNFSKVNVQNRLSLLQSFDEKDQEEEEEEEEVVVEQVVSRSSGRAVKKTSTGEYITKHNPAQNAKRNAQQIEKFTSTAHLLGNIQGKSKSSNGDEFGDQIVINHTIYNTLRNFARKQDSHSSHYKPQDELFSTQEKVLDNRTRVALLKMLNNGVIGEMNGVISTGKESSVYHAWGLQEEENEDEEQEEEWEDVPEDAANDNISDQPLTRSVVEKTETEAEGDSKQNSHQETEGTEGTEETEEDNKSKQKKKINKRQAAVPERPVFDEYAIKIFKTTLNEFKNRGSYMETDLSKQNPRKIIKLWVEREVKNLRKLQENNIPTPTPVHHKDHILVMSFLGQDGVPAPKLKEAELKPKQMQKIYNQVVECMRTMYQKCGLVHADLSEYNILVHNNSAYFIDVCQSVDTTHPNALDFLTRDCQSITTFFQKKDLPDVMTKDQLIEFITSSEVLEDDTEGEQ